MQITVYELDRKVGIISLKDGKFAWDETAKLANGYSLKDLLQSTPPPAGFQRGTRDPAQKELFLQSFLQRFAPGTGRRVFAVQEGDRQDSIRPSCWDCVNKHVGSAIVLMQEAEHGYPEHKLLAIGHLAQAEEESLRQMPDVAAALREIRRRYHAGDDIDVTEFYEALGMNVDALPSKGKRQRKIRKVMREFKAGKLKSSAGDPVTDRRQAIAIALSMAERVGKPRTDAFPTYRQRLPLPGGAIAALTHLPGDVRHGRYMKAGYGVVLGTYGLGRDGKSLDLYVGDAPDSDQVWRILQTTPDGDPDEYKYMIHCRDKAHARKVFIDHAGMERFGAIEPAGWEELRPKKSRGAT